MTVLDYDNDLVDDEVVRLNPTWTFALGDVPQPGPWWLNGACRTAPPSIFFIGRGESPAPARQVCASCGVRRRCLEYALDAGDDLKGIWGGETERGRRRLRKERQAADAALETSSEPAEPRVRAARGRGEIYKILVALTAHPDRWARVGSYPTNTTGGALASMFRSGQRPKPPGDWQFEGRVNDSGGSDLYARYLGVNDGQEPMT